MRSLAHVGGVSRLVACFAVALLLPIISQAQGIKPLKALLVIGGCCHDYDMQKDILKSGISSRKSR